MLYPYNPVVHLNNLHMAVCAAYLYIVIEKQSNYNKQTKCYIALKGFDIKKFSW